MIGRKSPPADARPDVLVATGARLDDHGVAGMVWPVARREVLDFRDAFIDALSPELRRDDDDDASRTATRVLFKWILLRSMEDFQRTRVRDRLGYADAPLPPDLARLPALREPAPPFRDLVRQLERGPGTGRRVPARLKRLVLDVRWNGPAARLGRASDPERDVFVVQPNPLLVREMEAAPDSFRATLSYEWFGSLDDAGDAGAIGGSDRAMAATLAAVTERAYGAVGSSAPGELLDLYARGFGEALARARVHVERLGAAPAELPLRLWNGSAGNVWGGLLARQVRREGGHVTGFDHGGGNGYMLPNTRQFIELDHCDRFHTYNEAQAAALAALTDPERALGPLPEIQAPPPAGRRAVRGTTSGPIRRVLYVPTIYPAHRTNIFPALPDVVALDWQARLFARLRDWGIQLLHKPHPEGPLRPPDGFAERFGHRTLLGPMEDHMAAADAFLFDWPYTTTFPAAVVSDKPIIYVDIDFPGWFPDAGRSFQRRATVVPAAFDEENRVRPDWDRLEAALKADRHEWDAEFAERYHG